MSSRELMRASFGSLILLIFAIMMAVVFGEPTKPVSEASASEITVMPAPPTSTPVPPTPTPTPILNPIQIYLKDADPDIMETMSKRCIVIRKDYIGAQTAVTLSASYVDRTITLQMTGGDVSHNYDRSVIRIVGESIWDEQPRTITEYNDWLEELAVDDIDIDGSDEIVEDGTNIDDNAIADTDFVVAMESSVTQTGTNLTLMLDHSYEYFCHEDESYYYICCVEPKTVYDKVIVVDAGHGGSDPGTTVAGSANYEKNFNLDIVLRLKALFDEDDSIHVYYTRTDDRHLTLNQRVNLANDMGADFFISVHCNSAKSAYIGGTEVLYNQYQNDWAGFNSKRLAQIMLECVNEKYPLMNRGIIPRAQNVLIIEYAQMPVALLEVAYLSNSANLKSIQSEDNRQAVAQGLYDTIKKAYEEVKELQ